MAKHLFHFCYWDGISYGLAHKRGEQKMKFKHHATDKIIEVIGVHSEEHEVVYCKELDKCFIVMRKLGYPTYLAKTSYVEVGK